MNMFKGMNMDILQGYIASVHKSRKPDDNFIHAHLFIEKRANICERQSFGILHVFIDCWKRWANTGPNSVAINLFRTLGYGSSVPKAKIGSIL